MGDTNTSHPDRAQLDSFVHGRLEYAQQLQIERHVENCDDCREVLRSIPHDEFVEQLRSSAKRPPRDAANSGKMASVPPELVDHPRYKIVGQIGAGGMGVVYRAEHRIMERSVALKVINSKLVESEDAIERFRLEVKAAARLSHRNIVTAFDAEVAGDSHFLVMEFVEGSSLWERVKHKGRLSVLHACNYVMQAANGLQHAMEQGMVHRDIKPNNLMRTKKGVVKILDFGLAKFANQQLAEVEETGLTSADATLGTPDFIAPEQARSSRTADIRADIYSLGCTLYFLLSGRVPFPTGTIMEKVVAHFEREPESLDSIRNDVPYEVASVISKMMAKDPDNRFQTPGEVAAALAPFGTPEKSSIAKILTSQATVGNSATKPDTKPIDAAAIDLSELPSKSASANKPSANKTSGNRISMLIIAGVIVAVGAAAIPFAMYAFWGGEAPTIMSADKEWIELLPQVDPSRDSVQGQWRPTPQGLTVNSVANARLMLPYVPPEEYDFEVEFTRTSGSNSIALHFVAGTGQATFDIDAWNEHLAGIQNINDETLRANATRVEDIELVNGQRHTALVQVRRGEITVFLDGNRLTTHRGDGSNLSMLDVWRLPDSQSIGIGAYASSTTFHSIRVREFSPLN